MNWHGVARSQIYSLYKSIKEDLTHLNSNLLLSNSWIQKRLEAARFQCERQKSASFSVNARGLQGFSVYAQLRTAKFQCERSRAVRFQCERATASIFQFERSIKGCKIAVWTLRDCKISVNAQGLQNAVWTPKGCAGLWASRRRVSAILIVNDSWTLYCLNIEYKI